HSQDRYHDFMISARIYRHLTMMKRAGKAHDIVLSHRNPRDITFPCITCPWPDFNLPSNWKEAPPHLRYLYRIVFAMDGNYSLRKKTKEGDADNVALSEGQGVFVP
ncbi:hypothetical protein C8Q76DRAFT_566227, partial [Earliella scabrosa]